jgi:hypothetical protein
VPTGSHSAGALIPTQGARFSPSLHGLVRAERNAGALLRERDMAKASLGNQHTGPLARHEGSKPLRDLGCLRGCPQGQRERNRVWSIACQSRQMRVWCRPAG